MNREREGPLESEIDLFAEVLSVRDTEDGPVIVGGHAAGLWSRCFLADVWSIEELTALEAPKVVRWLEHRFP